MPSDSEILYGLIDGAVEAEKSETKSLAPQKHAEPAPADSKLNRRWEDVLELTGSARHALRSYAPEVVTIRDLISLTPRELNRIPCLGVVSQKEIKEALRGLDLRLRDPE